MLITPLCRSVSHPQRWPLPPLSCLPHWDRVFDCFPHMSNDRSLIISLHVSLLRWAVLDLLGQTWISIPFKTMWTLYIQGTTMPLSMVMGSIPWYFLTPWPFTKYLPHSKSNSRIMSFRNTIGNTALTNVQSYLTHCRVLLGCWGKCLGNDNTDPSRSSGIPNPSYHLLSSLKRYIYLYTLQYVWEVFSEVHRFLCHWYTQGWLDDRW